jgi:hypothetical protein
MLRLGLLAARYVAYEGESETAVYGFEIAQADFHRELAYILAAPDKIEELPHRPDPGIFEETRYMPFMNFAQAFGKEKAMGFPYELHFWITEHLLCPGVDEQNGPMIVDDNDSFSERLKKGAYRDVSLEKSRGEGYLPLYS